jgi:hypothetical protein
MVVEITVNQQKHDKLSIAANTTKQKHKLKATIC